MSRSEPPLVDDDERAWLLGEARRITDFARGALSPEDGYGWLDNQGRRLDRPLELYIGARMAHVFSLGVALRGDADREHLVAAASSLDAIFGDRQHGGWLHSTDIGADPYPKTAYDHVFVVLASASATARGIPDGEPLLRRSLDVIEQYFWDDDEGLVRESFSRDWSHAEPYRGANSNMHAVEAFLAASDVTRDPIWRDRALRIADRVINGFARENNWRIPEHFDENWQPLLDYNVASPGHPFRPYGATVGHGMEWARLCLHLDAATGSNRLVEAAIELYARAKADGWAVDGADGFVYSVDWNGRPVVRERMHWVIAEATAAAAALHRVTGDRSYADDFHLWWDHIRATTIDRVNGSWHHELSCVNEPSETVWQGKPDAYHAVQACLIPLLPLAPSIALSVADLSVR